MSSLAKGEPFALTKTFLKDGSTVRSAWVEVSLCSGASRFEIDGFSSLQTRGWRERIRAAVVNSGFDYPLELILVRVSLARRIGLPPWIDLAIAVALLCASGQLVWKGTERVAFVSELTLDGSTRPAQGIQPMVEHARACGDEMILVPGGCWDEATRAEGIAVIEVESLSHLREVAAG
jgi:magnesium chelatase family protein